MDSQENQGYKTLLMLDQLETLLEELEEHGITGLEPSAQVPADLRQQMADLGVKNVQDIRDKIMRLHVQVDQDETEGTITES